jgi:hypothetical protein
MRLQMVFQILYFSGNLLTAYSKLEVYVMFPVSRVSATTNSNFVSKLGKLHAVLF